MDDLHNHADVIGLWPSNAEFARTISLELPGDQGISADNVRMMRFRKSIPPRYFEAIAAAAEKRGYVGLTYARLTELGRRPTT